MIENDVIFENENLKILYYVDMKSFDSYIIYQLGDKIITYDEKDKNSIINFLVDLLKHNKIDNKNFIRIFNYMNKQSIDKPKYILQL